MRVKRKHPRRRIPKIEDLGEVLLPGDLSLRSLAATLADRIEVSTDPPAGMERWQHLLVEAGHLCGAPTGRFASGLEIVGPDVAGAVPLYCRSRTESGVAGSGCRKHPCGKRSPLDGLWLDQEELEDVEAILGASGSLLDVDAEIAAAKMRLMRELLSERTAQKKLASSDPEGAAVVRDFDVVEKTGEDANGPISIVTTSTKRRVPDFSMRIHRMFKEVRDLVQLRADLKGGSSESAQDVAARIRRFIRDVDDLHTEEVVDAEGEE